MYLHHRWDGGTQRLSQDMIMVKRQVLSSDWNYNLAGKWESIESRASTTRWVLRDSGYMYLSHSIPNNILWPVDTITLGRQFQNCITCRVCVQATCGWSMLWKPEVQDWGCSRVWRDRYQETYTVQYRREKRSFETIWRRKNSTKPTKPENRKVLDLTIITVIVG